MRMNDFTVGHFDVHLNFIAKFSMTTNHIKFIPVNHIFHRKNKMQVKLTEHPLYLYKCEIAVLLTVTVMLY